MKAHLLRGRRLRLLVLLLVTAGILFALNTPAGRRFVSIPASAIKPKKPAVPKTKPPAEPKLRMELVKWFDFSDPGSLQDWEEKVFKGRVGYTIEKENGISYVKAESQGAASSLYYKIDLDRGRDPVISWRWRVDKFPAKTAPDNIDTQDEHDFAARVYVIFPAVFILNSKVLEYIWAKDLPVGTAGTSPYSQNIKLMVLEKGEPAEGEWRFEERDIAADYEKAFGRRPEKDAGAIAFMTNSEHTGSVAIARYDDIKVGYREENTGRASR
jgi:hypothetical protein